MMKYPDFEGVEFISSMKYDWRVQDKILRYDVLFIMFDSEIGDEMAFALQLAGQARAAGILTLSICCVEDPMASDASQRWQILEQLRSNVDALAIVVNSNNPSIVSQEREMKLPYSIADECRSIVHALSYIFSHRSYVGIDFGDVREVLSGSSYAAIGAGHAQGANRGVIACNYATQDLTNKGIDLRGAHGVSVKISGHQASLDDFSDAMEYLESLVLQECRIVAAAYWEDVSVDESLSITILVSGLTRESVATMVDGSAVVVKTAS